MSSLGANEIREINLSRYLILIAFTILVHEYSLTFTLEVERFWSKNKATWPVFLFFLNRYLVVLGSVPIIVHDFWHSTSRKKPEICRDLRSFHEYYVVVVQVVISAMLIMRTYALYQRSRRVLVLMLSVALTVAAIACWSIVSGKADDADQATRYLIVNGCASPVSRTAALRYMKAWGGLLAFDTLIFSLTVYKTFALRVGSGSGLLSLMLRDGSIYFGVMVTSGVANLLTYAYGGPFTRGVGTIFVNSLSSAMITRLMLNIRDPRLSIASRRSSAAIRLRNLDNLSTLIDPGTEIDGMSHDCTHRSKP